MKSKPRLFPKIFLQRLFIGAILGPILPAFASIPSVLVGIKNPQTVGITWFFRISWDEQILPVKIAGRLVRMRSPVRIWAAAPTNLYTKDAAGRKASGIKHFRVF